jgi:hypothetical protein
MNNDRIQKTIKISCIVLGIGLVCFLWAWSFPLTYLALQIYLPIRWKGSWRKKALTPLLVGVPAILGLGWMIGLGLSGVRPEGQWQGIALLPYLSLTPVLIYFLILIVKKRRSLANGA